MAKHFAYRISWIDVQGNISNNVKGKYFVLCIKH